MAGYTFECSAAGASGATGATGAAGLASAVEKCRELGYYAKIIFLRGTDYYWQPCRADDTGASVDLERFYRDFKWDPIHNRWEPVIKWIKKMAI